jgi:FixJ family two-component response regulator
MIHDPAAVWVVDDDVSVRRAVQRLLAAAGHHVETFANARDVLLSDPAGDPACLILDIRMPEVSGVQLLDALYTAGRDIPIIFITGHGDDAMAAQVMNAGAVAFLSKPVDEQVLLAAVDQALASRGARRSHRR